MVGHNEEWKAYRGSRTAPSLVAFYADCRHEVLKVNSGYRITLTYSLLLHGDTSRPSGDDGTAAELAGLLREHFSTPVPSITAGRRPTHWTGPDGTRLEETRCPSTAMTGSIASSMEPLTGPLC